MCRRPLQGRRNFGGVGPWAAGAPGSHHLPTATLDGALQALGMRGGTTPVGSGRFFAVVRPGVTLR